MRLETKRLKSLATAKSCDEETISKEKIFAYCHQNFNKGLANIIELEKSPQGYRYTTEYKQFALTVYFLGPNKYKYLQKMFQLPSSSTLYRITRNWDISPGVNTLIFCILETKIQTMDERERNCTICMDEISIKKFIFYNRTDHIVGFHETSIEKKVPVKSVFVIMARGLFSN